MTRPQLPQNVEQLVKKAEALEIVEASFLNPVYSQLGREIADALLDVIDSVEDMERL